MVALRTAACLCLLACSTTEEPIVAPLIGDPADSLAVPSGPALLLAGGGTDVTAAMSWLTERSGGGDVVILGTSGGEGYEDYLYADIGGVDSVEALLVATPEQANSLLVRKKLQLAEAIFISGGDQSKHLKAWRGTAVEEELHSAWARGAIIGGTSAGAMIIGDTAFAATLDTVYSDEALADPFDPLVTLEPGLFEPPPLSGVIVDSHFAARDRMGRLLTFVARMSKQTSAPLGIGVDEATALLVEADGLATVIGNGSVYFIDGSTPPVTCEPGQPLEFATVSYFELAAGETFLIPDRVTTLPPHALSVANGVLSPAQPY